MQNRFQRRGKQCQNAGKARKNGIFDRFTGNSGAKCSIPHDEAGGVRTRRTPERTSAPRSLDRGAGFYQRRPEPFGSGRLCACRASGARGFERFGSAFTAFPGVNDPAARASERRAGGRQTFRDSASVSFFIMSPTSMGLAMCACMPASAAARSSSLNALAVIARIGMFASAGSSSARMARVAS